MRIPEYPRTPAHPAIGRLRCADSTYISSRHHARTSVAASCRYFSLRSLIIVETRVASLLRTSPLLLAFAIRSRGLAGRVLRLRSARAGPAPEKNQAEIDCANSLWLCYQHGRTGEFILTVGGRVERSNSSAIVDRASNIWVTEDCAISKNRVTEKQEMRMHDLTT